MLDHRGLSLLLAVILLCASPHQVVGQSPRAAAPAGDREVAMQLLQQARKALTRGDIEQAERFVQQADSLNVKTESLLHPFADTPARVRKDIDRLRSARQSGPPQATQVAASGLGAPGAMDHATPGLRNLGTEWQQATGTGAAVIENPHVRMAAVHPLLQARMAVADGQLNAARQWVEQSRLPQVPQLANDSTLEVEKLIRRAENLGMAAARGGSDPTFRRQQADLWLDQAEKLMQYGVVDRAAVMVEQASSLQARFAPGERTPEELATQLRAVQLAGASGSLTNYGPDGLPPIVPSTELAAGKGPGVTDIASAQAAKQASLKLMAQAKLALDRQDPATADDLVRQALELGVPASAYHPQEMQPWMLQMQIDRALQRHAGVVAAAAEVSEGSGTAVQSGVYRPDQDETFVQLANADDSGSRLTLQAPLNALVQNNPPATLPAPHESFDGQDSAADSPESEGMRLFRQGTEAVQQGDLARARNLFRQAWSFEEELDPESRQRLQDHLQLLSTATAEPARSTEQEVEAPQRTLIRALYQEITREQIAAERTRQSEPKAAWERMKQLRDRVAAAEIDDLTRQQLLRRVELSLDEMQQYIDANRAMIELDERNAEVLRQVELRRRLKLERQDQLAKLVDEFNSLMDQRRFPEAVVVAKKARELDAENPVVQNLLWKSHFAQQMAVDMSVSERSQSGFTDSIASIREASIPIDDRRPYQFPDQTQWAQLTKNRKRLNQRRGRAMSEADRYIHEALKKPVEVSFDNEPLGDVLTTLSKLANVNMVVDPQGLAAEGINTDTPVSLPLSKPVQLRSALNLILRRLRLGYVIQDEVLMITSEQNKSSESYTDTYAVADLVIPIPNFSPTYYMGLPAAIREAHNMLGYGGAMGGFARAPMTVMADHGAQQQTQASVLAQMASSGMGLPNAPDGAQSIGSGPGGLGGGAQADFDSLINLIVDTIAPDSWEETGLGEGKISSYDGNLSLVVRQTEDVHEEIADLLDQLRRLQDLQVTIEVRFISLNDDFFERIGVDFDFNIRDKLNTAPSPDGPSVTIGIDQNGNPTPNLDLQFTQGSFSQAVPTFGGFDPNTAANFGFAVLSDIEAFFVIQAAQGDNRTNVLQAPKVTLFNGQQASIQDQAQRPFVISVIPVVGDFAAAYQPVIAVLSEGTSLNVQAVVSNDRRFVRLTLTPFFSTIDDVETFTFEGSRRSTTGTAAVDPTDDQQTVNDNAENFDQGTTVQLPTFAFTTVATTVSVPDGGTILLGGIKRLREGRNEAGVPLVNKIPFVNRLFNNVGIARQASSLMMMVTPRIIIQEEEEENLGIVSP